MSGFIVSKGWKSFMAKLYGLGAAVVIVGAMFKIMHWPGAGPMLVTGLSTEAVIFFFSAFEPPHEEVDWSLVYPELAGMHGEGHEATGHSGHSSGGMIEEKGSSVTQQLDEMLEEAKIGPDLIASLGTGLRNLSEQTTKLSDITDVSVASNEFASSIKSASNSVGSLSESYTKAADNILSSTEELSKASKSLNTMTSSTEETQNFYGQELQKVSKNLSALNASYELQLQNSNEHLKTTSRFHEGLADLMKNLNDSVDDTRRYKEQIGQLSVNLESLNTIYGNMLTAMRK